MTAFAVGPATPSDDENPFNKRKSTDSHKKAPRIVDPQARLRRWAVVSFALDELRSRPERWARTEVARADRFNSKRDPLKQVPDLIVTGDRLANAGASDAALESMHQLSHPEIEELRMQAAVALEQSRQTVRDRVNSAGPDADECAKLWPAVELVGSQQREWIATRQVPRSAVTLLVGDEGIGKSLMWVWLIAFITTGKPMPEYGIPARDPANVIIVATEDDWSTTVRPRLEVAGVDLARVHVIAAESDGSGSPTFPDDLDVIASAHIEPAVVVVDAWLDTVPAKLSVRDPQQARQALHPWKEYATSSGAAVLLLTHTNRVATANARDKYGATAELRKKARMTLFAQADSENDDCLIIGPEKSNIARSSEATRFRITSVQHFAPTDEDDGTVPLLEYAGTVGKSSRQLIADHFNRDDDENSNDLDAAKAWLTDYLGVHSPALSKPLKDAARKDEGISERTLKRAANEIGVVYASDGGFPRKTVWSLPGAQPFDPLDDPTTRTGQ